MGKLGQDWAPIQEMSSTKAGNESTHARGNVEGQLEARLGRIVGASWTLA
jgi:hypothetical protein